MRTIPNTNQTERRFDQVAHPRLDLATPDRAPLEVHRRLPGYVPSPLVDLPATAAELGLERLWLKDESSRLGLPAFKILGASWATVRALDALLVDLTGRPAADWVTLDDLAGQLAPLRPLTLACATDGNHGRAVARMARWLGLAAPHPGPRRHGAGAGGRDPLGGCARLDHRRDLRRRRRRGGPPGRSRLPGHLRHRLAWLRGRAVLGDRGLLDDLLGDRRRPRRGRGAGAGPRRGPDRGRGAGGRGRPPLPASRGRPGPRIVGVEPTRAACALVSMEAGERVALAGRTTRSCQG
jgi:diaminopropionate ammonia-lyase